MKYAKKSRQFSGTVRGLDAQKESHADETPKQYNDGSICAAITRLQKIIPFNYKFDKRGRPFYSRTIGIKTQIIYAPRTVQK